MAGKILQRPQRGLKYNCLIRIGKYTYVFQVLMRYAHRAGK